MEGFDGVSYTSDEPTSGSAGTITVELSTNDEAKRQCILAISDQLKLWGSLGPTAREKFMIASITDAFGWSPDMYVDLGFDHEGDGTQGE